MQDRFWIARERIAQARKGHVNQRRKGADERTVRMGRLTRRAQGEETMAKETSMIDTRSVSGRRDDVPTPFFPPVPAGEVR